MAFEEITYDVASLTFEYQWNKKKRQTDLAKVTMRIDMKVISWNSIQFLYMIILKHN